MIDFDEADDKLVAVLENDDAWGTASDLSDVPEVLIERLRHYFLTYKSVPESQQGDEGPKDIEVDRVYGVDHAQKVLEASMADYDERYGD